MDKFAKILALAQVAQGLFETGSRIFGLIQNIDSVTVTQVQELAAESRAAREAAEKKLLSLIEKKKAGGGDEA